MTVVGIGIAELIVLLTLGGSMSPTNLVHSQPLLWLGGSVARAMIPAGVATWMAAPMPLTPLGGPVGIVGSVAPPKPPSVAPSP